MRARLAVPKPLEQQRLDFWRNGVLHGFSFRVSLRPRKPYNFGEQHFSELMPEHQALRKFASLGGKEDMPSTLYRDVAIARHALHSGRDGWRGHVEFLSEPRADGYLLLLEHFPNRFEVIFLRNAGFVAAQ